LYTVYSLKAKYFVLGISLAFYLCSLISEVKGLSPGLKKASIPACPFGRQLSRFVFSATTSCLSYIGLTLSAPRSTYKFSKLISIHFLTELVERIILFKDQSIFP